MRPGARRLGSVPRQTPAAPAIIIGAGSRRGSFRNLRRTCAGRLPGDLRPIAGDAYLNKGGKGVPSGRRPGRNAQGLAPDSGAGLLGFAKGVIPSAESHYGNNGNRFDQHRGPPGLRERLPQLGAAWARPSKLQAGRQRLKKIEVTAKETVSSAKQPPQRPPTPLRKPRVRPQQRVATAPTADSARNHSLPARVTKDTATAGKKPSKTADR